MLALLGVIYYLVSVLNEGKYYLVPEEGQIFVRRGLFFPFGTKAFDEGDPEGEAYAPIEIPAGVVAPRKQTFAGLVELDNLLFGLLREYAEHELKSDTPDTVDRD